MEKERTWNLQTYLGTTGSSSPFAASIASFHLAVHKHHLQPSVKPMSRRLFPREAEKSRNLSVTTPSITVRQPQQLEQDGYWREREGGKRQGVGREEGGTCNGMIALVLGPDTTVAVAVETGHWFLGEETEGLFED